MIGSRHLVARWVAVGVAALLALVWVATCLVRPSAADSDTMLMQSEKVAAPVAFQLPSSLDAPVGDLDEAAQRELAALAALFPEQSGDAKPEVWAQAARDIARGEVSDDVAVSALVDDARRVAATAAHGPEEPMLSGLFVSVTSAPTGVVTVSLDDPHGLVRMLPGWEARITSGETELARVPAVELLDGLDLPAQCRDGRTALRIEFVGSVRVDEFFASLAGRNGDMWPIADAPLLVVARANAEVACVDASKTRETPANPEVAPATGEEDIPAGTVVLEATGRPGGHRLVDYVCAEGENAPASVEGTTGVDAGGTTTLTGVPAGHRCAVTDSRSDAWQVDDRRVNASTLTWGGRELERAVVTAPARVEAPVRARIEDASADAEAAFTLTLRARGTASPQSFDYSCLPHDGGIIVEGRFELAPGATWASSSDPQLAQLTTGSSCTLTHVRPNEAGYEITTFDRMGGAEATFTSDAAFRSLTFTLRQARGASFQANVVFGKGTAPADARPVVTTSMTDEAGRKILARDGRDVDLTTWVHYRDLVAGQTYRVATTLSDERGAAIPGGEGAASLTPEGTPGSLVSGALPVRVKVPAAILAQSNDLVTTARVTPATSDRDKRADSAATIVADTSNDARSRGVSFLAASTGARDQHELGLRVVLAGSMGERDEIALSDFIPSRPLTTSIGYVGVKKGQRYVATVTLRDRAGTDLHTAGWSEFTPTATYGVTSIPLTLTTNAMAHALEPGRVVAEVSLWPVGAIKHLDDGAFSVNGGASPLLRAESTDESGIDVAVLAQPAGHDDVEAGGDKIILDPSPAGPNTAGDQREKEDSVPAREVTPGNAPTLVATPSAVEPSLAPSQPQSTTVPSAPSANENTAPVMREPVASTSTPQPSTSETTSGVREVRALAPTTRVSAAEAGRPGELGYERDAGSGETERIVVNGEPQVEFVEASHSAGPAPVILPARHHSVQAQPARTQAGKVLPAASKAKRTAAPSASESTSASGAVPATQATPMLKPGMPEMTKSPRSAQSDRSHTSAAATPDAVPPLGESFEAAGRREGGGGAGSVLELAVLAATALITVAGGMALVSRWRSPR